MEPTSPSRGGSFSRYACDYCREKKLRCTRELPKCAKCKPWPGDCIYSHDRPTVARKKRSRSKSPVSENPALQSDRKHSDTNDRLLRLEQAIQSLTSSVDQVVRGAPTTTANSGNLNDLPRSDRNIITPQNRTGPGLYFGPSYPKLSVSSGHATSRRENTDEREVAYSELQKLSTAAKLNSPKLISTGESEEFYVPLKSDGYRLLGKFFEAAGTGEPIFRPPSDDVVIQVIFEPHRVREKAWVVLVNYILLSAFSADGQESDLTSKLRCNTRLALNDSSIFLEPSVANIQSLTLLALHGEDYAAPSLSWMLLGHACRQAEALNLHAPAPQDESRQQKLCLFWLLFMVDKSCSLSFGRASFLPITAYSNVPEPEEQYLLKFHPHENGTAHGAPAFMAECNFGAHLFGRSIGMSKLTSSILDLLATGGPASERESLRLKLDLWYQKTNRILLQDINIGIASLNETQRQEMVLGLNSLKFQYLHVLILLLRGDDSSSTLRLELSREAIGLLPSMVSNWGSVYNGVVWHLLYYAFIPFFVIVENIMQHRGPSTPVIDNDLSHLSTAVEYFGNMELKMNVLAIVCARLQHVANSFYQLARGHIDEEARKSGVNCLASTTVPQKSTTVSHTRDPDISNFLEWLPSDFDAICAAFSNEQPNSTNIENSLAYSNCYVENMPGRSTLDNTFDWFSWDAYYKEGKLDS